MLVFGLLVFSGAAMHVTAISTGLACEYDAKKDVCIDIFCEINQGECLLPIPPEEECLCRIGE
ncbi:MAG TPA: hypothetical protein VMM93_00430 [Vicinamibacterales bacterium]|nr:hypothetical protein [Vicinamibacterales bacterium]